MLRKLVIALGLAEVLMPSGAASATTPADDVPYPVIVPVPRDDRRQ